MSAPKLSRSSRPEYGPWIAMVARCTKPSNPSFKKYGARGIRVTMDWLGKAGFDAFLAHIGPRPSMAHTIDRYPDKFGDYEPGNVRWATPTEQSRNQSSNRVIEFNGEQLCMAEWAERLGMAKQSLARRLRTMPLDRALSQGRRRRNGAIAKRLRPAQWRALEAIAEDGNADLVFYFARGANPGAARAKAEETLSALVRRGLISDTVTASITDAGRAALAAHEGSAAR